MTPLERHRPTWLENVIAMALVLAAVDLFSHLGNIGKEVFSHMGRGAGGWTAYVVAMLIGGLVVIAAFTQLAVRFRGSGPRPTWGEMLGSFLIVSIVGVFGYTFADALQGEVRLEMSAGHWWTIQLGSWPGLQGAVGWMLAMFMFVGVWATVSQVARSWYASKEFRISK